jgi:hypothetical protein
VVIRWVCSSQLDFHVADGARSLKDVSQTQGRRFLRDQLFWWSKVESLANLPKKKGAGHSRRPQQRPPAAGLGVGRPQEASPSASKRRVCLCLAGDDRLRPAAVPLLFRSENVARLAHVSLASVKRLETATEIRGSADTYWKIQTALEEAGVEFIPADDTKGPGVRLKKRQR